MRRESSVPGLRTSTICIVNGRIVIKRRRRNERPGNSYQSIDMHRRSLVMDGGSHFCRPAVAQLDAFMVSGYSGLLLSSPIILSIHPAQINMH
ncbi:hypothetical protein QQ045_006507 [Rhodiola kirilowii]